MKVNQMKPVKDKKWRVVHISGKILCNDVSYETVCNLFRAYEYSRGYTEPDRVTVWVY